MARISYAQNREDMVLSRAPGSQSEGFYVDVGAWHPVLYSVTFGFYQRGWRGMKVKPLAGHLKLLRRERPEDVNLGVGIAARSGECTFYEDLTAPGLSTFSPAQAASCAPLVTSFASARGGSCRWPRSSPSTSPATTPS